MKNPGLLFVCLIVLHSCIKDESLDTCRLEKFVQENPINKSFHYDNLSLKDGRIEKMVSFDININKDTLNKLINFFEYNQNGKVKSVRDESNPKRIKRYDGDFDSKGNVIKITQTINGHIEDEITLEYDNKNRLITIASQYLLGLNRSLEYDNKGNPYVIFRSDLGSTPSITEHTFDDKRNFFQGIPAIQFYWIIRPLNSFLPFGENNITSSKVYLFEGREYKESVSQRTKRELTYNAKGFPETIKIIREDLSSTVSNLSSLSYICQ